VGDEEGQTVQFLLPVGAINVRVDEVEVAGKFIIDDETIWATDPLPPGTAVTQHVIGYMLPYNPDEELVLAREYAYPVSSLNLLVPEVGVEVAVSGLELKGTMGQQQQYLNYAAENLPQGERWSVTFRGQPTAGTGMGTSSTSEGIPVPESSQRTLLAIGLGLTVLAAFAPFVYLGLRKPTPEDGLGRRSG
jgi:hypothetical protein